MKIYKFGSSIQRSFFNNRISNSKFCNNFKIGTKAMVKQTNSNVTSCLRQLKDNLEFRDAVFVSSQSTRWTAKELDFHSDSFGNFIVENKLNNGKVLFWTDVNHSLETISSMMGCLKAGMSIVFADPFNNEQIVKALETVDLLIVSPFTKTDTGDTRISALSKIIPEIGQLHIGDVFQCKKFQNLQNIIQISHKTLPGLLKFKQCFNYSRINSLSNIETNNIAFEFINNTTTSLSHNDCLEMINSFNNTINHKYSNIINSSPVFYPISFTLGLLAGFVKKNYIVFPGSYSFQEIAKLIETQNSKVFICEDNLLEIKFKDKEAEKIRNITKAIEEVIVFSKGDSEYSLDNIKK